MASVFVVEDDHQIRELAEMVHRTVPDSKIGFASGAGPDKRCYKVDFGKYERTFPDFPLQWEAARGVRNIYEAYVEHGLGRDEYEGPRYKRIAQLKELLATGQLDSTLRWVSSEA